MKFPGQKEKNRLINCKNNYMIGVWVVFVPICK